MLMPQHRNPSLVFSVQLVHNHSSFLNCWCCFSKAPSFWSSRLTCSGEEEHASHAACNTASSWDSTQGTNSALQPWWKALSALLSRGVHTSVQENKAEVIISGSRHFCHTTARPPRLFTCINFLHTGINHPAKSACTALPAYTLDEQATPSCPSWAGSDLALCFNPAVLNLQPLKITLHVQKKQNTLSPITGLHIKTFP